VIRLVVSNQRGGVAKTTTVTAMARVFADMGKKVLIIDTDSQGSVASILNLKPEAYLYNFLVNNQAFRDCIVGAAPNIHVMCSNRRTVEAEAVFMGVTGREMAFDNVFPLEDDQYEIVLLDVAPSITLLQTCSMVYAKAILIPVAMDPLSLQGAMASIQTAASLNKLFRLNIKVAGILPVMVNRRLRMTDMILNSLDELAQTYDIPVLPPIRTDTAVNQAAKARKFIVDFDPKAKAVEDYTEAVRHIIHHFEGKTASEEIKASIIA
jgi:chromosome partitioning protein